MPGKEGASREWVYCYYWGRGRDVFKAKAFARDTRYKLYDDGGFFDLSVDPLEERPLHESDLTVALCAIRSKLQGVLDWNAR